MTFQEIILTLQKFWGEKGCVIGNPYDVETGAGTFNPDTFLMSLGPEPWKVAYVEPSRRPKDGRYGENPNRVYQHHQFQVIMKPSPENIQELYLESMMALGIDPKKHDIRFVEDNWESPTLGAWGLGWEVWLDGMEITQFTYFQQVGGLEVEITPAELTYGLERIALSQVADRKIKHFSGGMKRRINLLAGILHTPEVLFLDEPTVGVDVMSKNIIIDYLKELNEQGMSILYTSHHMQEAQEFCHRVAILDRGVLLCQGTPKELISQEKVQHLEEVFIRFTSQELAYE